MPIRSIAFIANRSRLSLGEERKTRIFLCDKYIFPKWTRTYAICDFKFSLQSNLLCRYANVRAANVCSASHRDYNGRYEATSRTGDCIFIFSFSESNAAVGGNCERNVANKKRYPRYVSDMLPSSTHPSPAVPFRDIVFHAARRPRGLTLLLTSIIFIMHEIAWPRFEIFDATNDAFQRDDLLYRDPLRFCRKKELYYRRASGRSRL